MAYSIPGICKQCGREYVQTSGIDLPKEDRDRGNRHYSCPICGSQEFLPRCWTGGFPAIGD